MMCKMLRVVGCFLEYEGRFVLLHRHTHKPDGDTWGLPAGKVEPGESDEAAILRELREETGYMALPSQLEYVREDPFHYHSGSVTFVIYKVVLKTPHDVRLEQKAHSEYKWVTPLEGSRLPLISGLRLVLRFVNYI